MKGETLKIMRIFVASPRDVMSERELLALVIEDLQWLANQLGITLELLEWPSVPPGAGRPEQIILDELQPKTWDVFVGILWHRFGSPPNKVNPQTGKKYLSGTEEEFRVAYRLWQNYGRPRVMFYRCRRDVPMDHLDPNQYKRVERFFKGFQPDKETPGLYFPFYGQDDFEHSIRKHLIQVLVKNSPRLKTKPKH